MEALGIEPARIDEVVISHEHWDHVGGLEALLERHGCPVVLPRRCPPPRRAVEVKRALPYAYPALAGLPALVFGSG